MEDSRILETYNAFDPLFEMALGRFGLNAGGVELRNMGEDEVVFVVRLMAVYDHPESFDPSNFRAFSISTLLEYLERTHIYYETKMLPALEQATEAMAGHFPEHSVCIALRDHFIEFRKDLQRHIRSEEMDLFPYARRLGHGGTPRDYSTAAFVNDHDHRLEMLLTELSEIIANGHPRVADSMAYRTFSRVMKHFLRDLHIHHRMEEEVLVPKLQTLETGGLNFPIL